MRKVCVVKGHHMKFYFVVISILKIFEGLIIYICMIIVYSKNIEQNRRTLY